MGKTFTWQVKIEYMLQASRDEARKVLEEATPEDVPMLRTLARKNQSGGKQVVPQTTFNFAPDLV